MVYLQSTGGQIGLFLRSIGFGALLGVLYDGVRFLCISVFPKSAQGVRDVLFGASAAFCTFLYNLIYVDGKLRLFVFAGQCAGFAAWYVLAAPFVRRMGEKTLCRVRRAVARICRPFLCLEQFWTKKMQRAAGSCRVLFKKIKNNQKTHQKIKKNS